MNGGSSQYFTRWLFTAYLDLGPVPLDAPHHLHGIDFAYSALVEDRRYPRVQAALSPSFRGVLINAVRAPQYDVRRPQDLPRELRTERWQRLCEACDSFSSLPTRAQARLVWLLGKLCFQEYLLELLPQSVESAGGQSDDHAAVAYLRAYSRYRLQLDDARHPYNIEEFARLAKIAPPGMAGIDAHYQVVVQNVKHHNNLAQVEEWQGLHLQAIERSRSQLDEFSYLLTMSRYHRVGGFIPQMRRERQRMIDEMELSEKYARALPRPDRAHATVADEMLYPVLESRTKEALWLGELDLALERAKMATTLSPTDSRAWLHQGGVCIELEDAEGARAAYRNAARFAPPGRDVGMFMAGQCSEELGDLESACSEYLAALDVDPMGISAAERLEVVAESLNNKLILDWVRGRLAQLREVRAPEARAEPYKHLPPPVEPARK